MLLGRQLASFMVGGTKVSDRLQTSNFQSSLMKTCEFSEDLKVLFVTEADVSVFFVILLKTGTQDSSFLSVEPNSKQIWTNLIMWIPPLQK